MTGTSEILPVAEGILWCVIGILLRNIYEANRRKITIYEVFATQTAKDLFIKLLVVFISMRFFRFIFDTDAIALAGLFIGLSLDYLPRVIVYLPKVILERFDFSGFLRKQSDKDIKQEFPEEERDRPYWDRYEHHHDKDCQDEELTNKESNHELNEEVKNDFYNQDKKDDSSTPFQEFSKPKKRFL